MSGKRKALRRPLEAKKAAPRGAVLAPSAEQLRKLAITCTEAVACYEVLAKRAAHADVSGEAAELALRHRANVAAVDALAAAAGHPTRRVSTCERLRWEWFASTAAVLDGAADARLAREGARLARDACSAARGLEAALRAELAACLDAALGLALRAMEPQTKSSFALV